MSKKSPNELIREDIKEVKDSIVSLADSFSNMEKISIKQQVSLDHHIKRSDLLEEHLEQHRDEVDKRLEALREEVKQHLEAIRDEIKPISTHVAVVGGIAKVVTFIGVLVSIAAGIAKIAGAF